MSEYLAELNCINVQYTSDNLTLKDKEIQVKLFEKIYKDLSFE